MTDPTNPADPAEELEELTYEEARDALVAVVSRLESGSPTLEESLALWERGEALADLCQSWLEAARTRLAAATARDVDPGDESPGTPVPGTDEAAAGDRSEE